MVQRKITIFDKIQLREELEGRFVVAVFPIEGKVTASDMKAIEEFSYDSIGDDYFYIAMNGMIYLQSGGEGGESYQLKHIVTPLTVGVDVRDGEVSSPVGLGGSEVEKNELGDPEYDAGFDCESCGHRMYIVDKMAVRTSHPPKKMVKCIKCGQTGFINA